jgi:hypothetical protein
MRSSVKKAKKIKLLYVVVSIFYYHILLYFFFTKESSFAKILQTFTNALKIIYELKETGNTGV